MKNKYKTRVAHIVSMKRGLPVFLYREIKMLRHKGIDVRLYVMRDGKGVAMPDPDWPVIKIRPLLFVQRHIRMVLKDPATYISSFLEAFREKCIVHFAEAVHFAQDMRESGINVIYCCEGTHALWIAYFARRWHKVPIVVTVHAEMITNQTHYNITRKAGHLSAKILTDTEYNKEKLVERFDLPEEKIEVARLWSPYEPDERVKIMIVGEWSERKGHEVVLDAFEQLNSEHYVLWVVGGGTWSGEYYDVQAEVKKRGLGDNVILWGRVSDDVLKVLFQTCDIFTLPCRTTKDGITEGLPVVLMEAMSYGRPVVSTFHVGIPELVEEILIEENNSNQLRDALKKLGEDPKLRERLGRRNREIISQRFSEKNIEVITNALYHASIKTKNNS